MASVSNNRFGFTPLHHPMNMGSSANDDPRGRRAFVAVVAALSKRYDLDWKQVDRDPAKDAASYYIQASESGGEPPGRWWGPAVKVAAIDYLLDGRYRMAADGTCQVWRGEGARRSGSLNGTTLHQLPQLPGSSDFLPNFLPKNAK